MKTARKVLGALLCYFAWSAGVLGARPLQAQVTILWNRSIEDSILSPSWETRRDAVAMVRIAADSLSATGRDHLVELLQRELDRTIPLAIDPNCCDEESYGSYMADLVQVVERFNDPRATPLLARGGIAFSMGSRFQVARAGDDAVPMLTGGWDHNPSIRQGVVATLGIMVRYADSTTSPLSADSRLAARKYILTAFAAPEAWLRRSAIDAALTTRDIGYLPVLRRLASSDSTMLHGRRYVAIRAGNAALILSADSATASPQARVGQLTETLAAWCSDHPGNEPGQCQSLKVKLDAVRAAVSRNNRNAAKGPLRAFVQEVQARGEAAYGAVWFAVFVGNASALLQKLG